MLRYFEVGFEGFEPVRAVVLQPREGAELMNGLSKSGLLARLAGVLNIPVGSHA